MIGSPSIWLGALEKRKYCKRQLEDQPSKELEDLAKSLIEANKHKEIDNLYLVFATTEDDLFISAGACDILRERHGNDYVDNNILGVRRPKTITERLKYWVTGQMPRYNGQPC